MFISQFIAYLKHEKRYSPHTINAYQHDLSEFSRFLNISDPAELLEITYNQGRNYIVWMMEQKQSESTIGRKISTLRSFYKYLLRGKFIKSDPMHLVKAPKIPKRLPVFIEEQKLIRLLDAGQEFSEDFKGHRDKLVMELLFGTGIRLSELIGIENEDVNYFEQTIRVLGKRNKERIIPVPAPLIRLIKNFIELKSLQKPDNISSRLVVNDKGLPAYPRLIYRIVNKYLGMITTQDKKSPHVLRHTYATSLLNNGADLNAIKELLGHASLAATQVYVHNNVERLKSIYKQAHPKA